MRMPRILAICGACLLAACGGGGVDTAVVQTPDPTPSQPTAPSVVTKDFSANVTSITAVKKSDGTPIEVDISGLETTSLTLKTTN